MKKIKNITMAVLVTVIGTGWVMAQGGSSNDKDISNSDDFLVIPEAEGMYRLVYPVKEAETVWVKIYDPEKDELFSERVKNKDGFMQSYDFSNLADGLYTIAVQTKNGKITKEINHRYQRDDINVSVKKDPADNSYNLLVTGVMKDPVYIDLLDANRNTIYKDEVNVGKSFSKVYKFKNQLPDEVTFSVTSGGEEVLKEVK